MKTSPVPDIQKSSMCIPRCETEDLPLFSGEVLRDEGIKKVSEHNGSWMEQCLKEVDKFIRIRYYGNNRGDFTGEDIRLFLQNFVPRPNHPNAYGALINCLLRRKVIRATGKYRKPKDKSSHARAIQVYEAA